MRRMLILVLVSVLTIIAIIGCSSKSANDNLVSDNKVQEVNTETEKEEVKTEKEEVETEKEEVETEKEEVETEKEEVKAEIVERENIVGISNKKYSDIDTSKPSDVRNDTTGKWKLSTVATSEDILEYVADYYKTKFGNDKEIHAIVNFTLNTTTKVSKLFDNIIAVTVHEYVDKEEHDANKLFSGMVLGEYWIYLDNGDIEKIY